MKRTMEEIAPLARREDLVIQDLNEEVLVYDRNRHKAHSLNKTAAFIWKQCDGQTTVADIARRMGREFDTPVDDNLVWLGIKQLAGSRLLKNRISQTPDMKGLSRRQAVKLGLGAFLVLPAIISITAPKAHAAGSCTGNNRPAGCPCNNNNNCASNSCVGGVCA